MIECPKCHYFANKEVFYNHGKPEPEKGTIEYVLLQFDDINKSIESINESIKKA